MTTPTSHYSRPPAVANLPPPASATETSARSSTLSRPPLPTDDVSPPRPPANFTSFTHTVSSARFLRPGSTDSPSAGNSSPPRSSHPVPPTSSNCSTLQPNTFFAPCEDL